MLQPKPHLLHFQTPQAAWESLVQNAAPFVDTTSAEDAMCGPDRMYHSYAHCARMWDTWVYYTYDDDGLRSLSEAIAVATLYHDAVYNPAAEPGANEQQSADLLRDNKKSRYGEMVGMPYNMIMATANHWQEKLHGYQKIFADLELFSLCLRWDEFAFNNYMIRLEYQHKRDEEFRQGQIKLFSNWRTMASPIYNSNLLPTWCEAAAQSNLQRAVSMLHCNIAEWTAVELQEAEK